MAPQGPHGGGGVSEPPISNLCRVESSRIVRPKLRHRMDRCQVRLNRFLLRFGYLAAATVFFFTEHQLRNVEFTYTR